MKVPLLDLQAQYATIRDEIMSAVQAVFESQRFILGPEVAGLEQEICEYTGARHAIGVASGSDALLLSLMALEIQPGEGVITTPYTFFATAGTIARLQAIPIFVDIEPQTYNICPEQLALYCQEKCDWEQGKLIDRKSGAVVKVIIPVHLYGQCAEMEPILALAREYNLRVVEDAAQTIGARHHDRSAGTMGDLGCFSFFPSKNLGGAGDGGMIVTNEDHWDQVLRALRVHGSHPKYYYKMIGCNSRLDALQAAVLRVKLKYLDQWSAKRAQNAAYYDRGLQSLPDIVCPIVKPYNRSIYNQYVIRIQGPQGRRDALRDYLKEHQIGSEIYYPLPLHLQECFQPLGYQPGDFPVAEQAADQTLALPIYAELTTAQQDYVIETIQKFFNL